MTVSASSVYRVLSKAARLRKWNKKESSKGKDTRIFAKRYGQLEKARQARK